MDSVTPQKRHVSRKKEPMPTLWSLVADDMPGNDEDAFAGIAPVTSIRDSLYDVIPLGQLELELINSPAFLRLQDIKQLGFVYRIWPGATHSRYEHSLGVYYLGMRAMRMLAQRRIDGLQFTYAEIAQRLPQAFLAATLLHDIGHYPFSHAIEELGFPIISHEEIGSSLIGTGVIADILSRHGIDPELVTRMIAPPKDFVQTGAFRVLRQLLSGALDVDKLDYLPRDARACNVPYGGVDVARLLGAIRVIHTTAGLQLAVGAKGISPVHSLVHARQEMFDNIYWHHTGRAMIVMLLRAVQEALLAESIQPREILGHTDASLLALFAQSPMPAATRDLVQRIQTRKHHRVLIEISSRAGRIYQQIDALFWDAAKRRRAEIALSEALGNALGCTVPSWAILIDIPKPEKWEMDVTVCFETPPLGMKPTMSWVEATGQTSEDLRRYEFHQRRVRLVVLDEFRDAAQSTIDILLKHLEQLPVW